MPYRVEVSRAATRDLRRLPAEIRRRVTPVLRSLADEPRPHRVRKITDEDQAYRLRVGAYRVVYEVDDRQEMVVIQRVVRRSEGTYRNL